MIFPTEADFRLCTPAWWHPARYVWRGCWSELFALDLLRRGIADWLPGAARSPRELHQKVVIRGRLLEGLTMPNRREI